MSNRFRSTARGGIREEDYRAQNPVPIIEPPGAFGPVERTMWRSLSGKPISDIVGTVKSLLHDAHVVHVGTDSQQYGYHTNFVTVVAVVNPGMGGLVFYQRNRTPRTQSLAHRLFQEAEMSLGAACALNDAIAHDIVVHVDANEDLRHRSSRYVRALAGMVVGHGFQVRVKPNAWCATHVADFLVKGKRHAAA